MAGDIHYKNVSLLLHCNGANNSTTFTDSSSSPKTVTAAGSAKVVTSLADPYGVSGGVGAFDGTGDFLTTPTNSAFNLSNVFTIEGWIYLDSTTQDTFATILGSGQTTYVSGCRYLLVGSTRIVRLGGNFGSGSVDVVTASSALSASTWHHIAVTADGTTVRLFINGTLDVSATSSALFDFSPTQTIIGKNGWDGANGEFFGKISDLRITKGVARYTATFTPPVASYSNSTASLVGDITTTISVSSVIQMRRKMLVVGNISTSVSVSSTLLYHPKKTIVGDIPITVAVSATMVLGHPVSPIVGDITATITPTATLSEIYAINNISGSVPVTVTPTATLSEIYAINGIIGSIPIAVTPSATMFKYGHHHIDGSVGISVAVSSVKQFRQPINVTGSGFGTALESYINDFLELTITVGGFTTTLDANFGGNVSGGAFSSALSSTITGIPSLFVSGGAFSSDLSSTITSSSSTSVSGGSFKSALDSNFGANITGGGFNSSLSATFTGWASLSVSGGAFSSSLDSRIVEVGRINVSGGSFNSALLYMDVVGGGFSTLLDANISNQVSNAVAYVMNVHTSESTRYTNMAFSHIIQIGNKPYGIKPDGLYLLEGATDDGTVISGSITTKNTDLGTYQSKHIPFIYLNSDTDTTVTPIVDEVTKTANGSSFNGRRAKLAKGNKGRYWQFKIDDVIRVSGLEIPDEQRQRRVK